MSKVLVDDSSLSGIGSAIRSKNGSSTYYKPSEMAAAINAIDTGGITPTGSIAITQNGTVDVTQYASAAVAVPNSYAASDEGKVVSNGALVAQGSQTISQNGVYDTTLKDSVTVNVESGGDAVESIDQFEILALNNTLNTFVDKYGNNKLSISNNTKCMLFKFTGSFSNNTDVIVAFSLTKAQAEKLVGKYVNLKTYGTYSGVSVTGIVEQNASPWTRVAVVNQESVRSVIQPFPSGSYGVSVYFRVRGSANTSIDAYFALTVTDL